MKDLHKEQIVEVHASLEVKLYLTWPGFPQRKQIALGVEGSEESLVKVTTRPTISSALRFL